MSGVITIGNLPKALKLGVHDFFGMKYAEKEQQCKFLFDTETSTQAYEEDVNTSGLGLAPAKPEGAFIKFDSMKQGYTNRATHTVYGLGYQITQEEMEDNQYGDLLEQMMNKRTGQLAKSIRETKEVVSANVYNRAFNSAYTFGDGKEMIATDHPTDEGTFSNELATPTALSESSLEEALIEIRQFTDNRGKRIACQGEKLIVPSALKYVAERLLKSSMQTTVVTQGSDGVTNTNAINAIQNELAPYTNDYLTSDTAWFIRTNQEGLKNYQRREVEFSEDNSFDNGNAKFKATERYVNTCYDPRAIYGSAGA